MSRIDSIQMQRSSWQQIGNDNRRLRGSQRRDGVGRAKCQLLAVDMSVRFGRIGLWIAENQKPAIDQIDDPIVENAASGVEVCLFAAIEWKC